MYYDPNFNNIHATPTQACHPRMESLKHFSNCVYMYQSRSQFLQSTWIPAEFYVNLWVLLLQYTCKISTEYLRKSCWLGALPSKQKSIEVKVRTTARNASMKVFSNHFKPGELSLSWYTKPSNFYIYGYSTAPVYCWLAGRKIALYPGRL